nr:DUF6361 family protein [Guyparkeria hydrothermalis]
MTVASSFSWLDYSETERRQMLNAVQALNEPGTRDELGIGTVRDAISNLLFPGTSTIQTRARYFLLVPWCHLRVEAKLRQKRTRDPATIRDWIRSEEVSLIHPLSHSSDTDGVIGASSGKSVQRLPGSVYWQGLKRWGIRLFEGSQDAYARHLAENGPPISAHSQDEEACSAAMANWHGGLPDLPKDYPKNLSMALTQTEARYLKDRVRETVPGTLLAYLIDRPDVPFGDMAFPWDLLSDDHVSPGRLKDELMHASNFSLLTHGARLLYDCMLAKRAASELPGGWHEQIEQSEKHFHDWAGVVIERRDSLAEWDRRRDEFWDYVAKDNPRLAETNRTRQFIDQWFDLVLQSTQPRDLLLNAVAQDLIRKREEALKKNLARLVNRRALELWSGNLGADQLTFRWETVKTLLRDIHEGIAEEQGHARAAG